MKSFSNQLKEYLAALPQKQPCCREAYERGLRGEVFAERCARDPGCFLRGAFVGHGTISDPDAAYRLSFQARPEFLEIVAAALADSGIRARRTVRRGKDVLYFKDSGAIEDFLALVGASKYSLQLMEKKVMKELRENANRLRNAETANIDRTVRAAAEQCEAIRLLRETGKFALLPPSRLDFQSRMK